MAKLSLLKGTTSYRAYVFIQDSSVSTGAGKTGLVHNTASLKAYYVRPGASATSISLATQTVTGAWSSGGFVEVDATNMPGLYRLDVPDAALASGVNAVVIMLSGAANMVPCVLELELTAIDNQDATAGGLGRLDATVSSRATPAQVNTEADTALADVGLTTTITGRIDAAISTRSTYAGGDTSGTTTLLSRLTSGRAGNLDSLDTTISSRLASAGYTAPDNSTIAAIAGYLDTEIAAIKAKTDNLPASPAAVGSAMTLTSGERDAIAAALLDLANGVETGYTPRQILRILAAALAGKLSGAATDTVQIRNLGDTLNRITATTDEDGNRSAVSFNLG